MGIMLLILSSVAERLYTVHCTGLEVWGMQMSVVIVTRCFVTRSLIRDSGAEVVTGPGWETQSRETENREQRQLQSIREKEECELRSNLWTFWVDHSKCQHLWCLCMMPVVLWPWPPVLWWQCGLSHLVVTNKSNKNPQLIRSDSVQNSFSLLWPIVLGLIYSNVTDWACGNWLKKVRELFQKLFAVNWRWYP